MAYGWTDKMQRTLINVLVNSPKGSIFLDSVDVSDYSKTGEKIFDLLDRFVERVGEANVVQIVTNNASSNVLATTDDAQRMMQMGGFGFDPTRSLGAKKDNLDIVQHDWALPKFEHRAALVLKRLGS